MVGAAGFEPATPCSQGRCATKLRYAPMYRCYYNSNTAIIYEVGQSCQVDRI